MKTFTLVSFSVQAPDSGHKPSSILPSPSSAHPGAARPAEAGTPNWGAEEPEPPPATSALDVAAERLDLLAAQSAEDARLFSRCGLPADSAQARLEADALHLAAGTLRELVRMDAALKPANVIPWHWHASDDFRPACAVLLACADDLSGKALDALEGGFFQHPLEAAGYRAEASALRYAVAVLSAEVPATAEQLAA